MAACPSSCTRTSRGSGRRRCCRPAIPRDGGNSTSPRGPVPRPSSSCCTSARRRARSRGHGSRGSRRSAGRGRVLHCRNSGTRWRCRRPVRCGIPTTAARAVSSLQPAGTARPRPPAAGVSPSASRCRARRRRSPPRPPAAATRAARRPRCLPTPSGLPGGIRRRRPPPPGTSAHWVAGACAPAAATWPAAARSMPAAIWRRGSPAS